MVNARALIGQGLTLGELMMPIRGYRRQTKLQFHRVPLNQWYQITVVIVVLGLNWPRELGMFVSLPYPRFEVSR